MYPEPTPTCAAERINRTPPPEQLEKVACFGQSITREKEHYHVLYGPIRLAPTVASSRFERAHDPDDIDHHAVLYVLRPERRATGQDRGCDDHGIIERVRGGTGRGCRLKR